MKSTISGRPGVVLERKKDFFFEKKKQKTFTHWLRPFRRGSGQESKVFWFFFSKKNCFLA